MLETPPEVAQIDSTVRDCEETFREPLSNLAVDLTRVSAELHSINAGFQAHLLQALGEMQRAMQKESQARLEREIQATRQQVAKSLQTEFQNRLAQEVQATRDEMTSRLETEFQTRLEREIEATREQLLPRVTDVQKEITRVAAQLEAVTTEIVQMLDDPNAELSRVMRKKAEESILRSYLDGLKFAAGKSR
jgi:iron-sulfur cluster repair protein YtfE (RIC family)